MARLLEKTDNGSRIMACRIDSRRICWHFGKK
jgi:hypothetical protein